MRRQVGRRERLVRQRTRLKDIVQSIPHAHLVPPCPHADPFGAGGRAWLAAQALPKGERLAVERHVRTLDGLLADLRPVERDVARHAPDDGDVRRLMTVPGIDMVVAVGLAAAIGDVARFASAEKPVAYLGLNPSVRQSGDRNVYGWFEREGRGVYRLAPAGAAALLRWTALGDASVVDDAATTSGADALALAPSAGARGPAA